MVIESLRFALIFMDLQSYEIDRTKLSINRYVPQSILSEMFDPMLDREFRKYKPNEREHLRKQYNDLVSQLPIWTILDKQNFKYYDYQAPKTKDPEIQV